MLIAFRNYDIAIDYRGNGLFHASFMEHEEFIDGGIRGSSVFDKNKGDWKNVGYFTIQNGEIIFR